MRLLKRLLVVLLVVVVIAAAASYLLPGTATVARSITIAAPPEAVFPLVNDLKRSNDWSPWVARDPGMEQSFEGPDQGVGQKVTWQSDNEEVGSGNQQIVESVENRLVAVALDFGEMGTASARFTLEPAGGGTELTWGFETELGMNPVKRYMGLMFDGWIGPEYETGLKNIKSLAESGG